MANARSRVHPSPIDALAYFDRAIALGATVVKLNARVDSRHGNIG